MNSDLGLEEFHVHEPATRSAIADHERQWGYTIPKDYEALLLVTNGLQSGGNLSLLGIESIGERNRDYDVQSCLPDFVMIGDDSGGNAIVMKSGSRTIYEVSMGVMDEDSLEESAESLEALLVRYKGRTLSER